MFGQVYDGLGAQLQFPTRFVVEQGFWLYPGLFALFSVAVFAKEAMLGDKRLSVILTFVVTLVAQFVAHAMLTFYYLPLFDLISQLS